MRMIKASPHLSEYQRQAVENMIKCIHMDEAECRSLKLNGGANTIKLFNSKNDILNQPGSIQTLWHVSLLQRLLTSLSSHQEVCSASQRGEHHLSRCTFSAGEPGELEH